MLSISKSIIVVLFASACVASNVILNADLHQYGTLKPEEYDRPSAVMDDDILDMVSRMTTEEKVGQMTQVNQDLVLLKDGTLNKTAVEYYAKTYYVGSYLNQLAR